MKKNFETLELKDKEVVEVVEAAIEELEASEYLAWDKACRVYHTDC